MSNLVLVPLYVWWERYVKRSAGALLIRLSCIDLFCVVYVVFGGGGESYLNAFFYLFLKSMYVVIYEIGYLENDGLIKGKIAGVAVILRLILFTVGVLICARFFVGVDIVRFCVICVLGICCFYVHNRTRKKFRFICIFFLYFIRFLLPLCLLSLSFNFGYWLFSLALSASFSYRYSIAKNSFKRRPFEVPVLRLFNPMSDFFIIRVAWFALLLISCFDLAYFFLFLVLGGVDLALVVVLIISKFARSLNFDTVFHVHTRFSHDSDNSISSISRAISVEHGAAGVHLTDHAEDFCAASFSELKSEVSNFGDRRMRCGLEYNIFGQHVLAFDLSKFISDAEEDRIKLSGIKEYSSRLVWAHPHFAMRRVVLSRKYREELFAILFAVDAIEVVNFKQTRGIHFAWRHMFVGLIFLLLFRGDLTLGLDAHRIDDFGVLKKSPLQAFAIYLKGVIG